LLSHHPLFSPYSSVGLKELRQQAINEVIRDSFDLSKISAWLWGHEHSMAIYPNQSQISNNNPGLRCRLIGNGAMLVPSFKKIYDVNTELVNIDKVNVKNVVTAGRGTFFYHNGFAILTLNSETGKVLENYYEVEHHHIWDVGESSTPKSIFKGEF